MLTIGLRVAEFSPLSMNRFSLSNFSPWCFFRAPTIQSYSSRRKALRQRRLLNFESARRAAPRGNLIFRGPSRLEKPVPPERFIMHFLLLQVERASRCYTAHVSEIWPNRCGTDSRTQFRKKRMTAVDTLSAIPSWEYVSMHVYNKWFLTAKNHFWLQIARASNNIGYLSFHMLRGIKMSDNVF